MSKDETLVQVIKVLEAGFLIGLGILNFLMLSEIVRQIEIIISKLG